jgi:hypothetical protein
MHMNLAGKLLRHYVWQVNFLLQIDLYCGLQKEGVINDRDRLYGYRRAKFTDGDVMFSVKQFLGIDNGLG